MQKASAILSIAICCWSFPLKAQSPSGGQAAPVQAAIASAQAAPPSAGLKPALDTLQQTVVSLKTDKWKGNALRAEAMNNINSIQRDIAETLPPMLTAADGAPGRVSVLLPVAHNVDALYDVGLRVLFAARAAAPVDQIGPLQDAMTKLEEARRGLGDQILDASTTQEKQFAALQNAVQTLKTQPAPVCPVTPPASSEAKPAVKKKKKPAAAKPATTAPNGSTPANATSAPQH